MSELSIIHTFEDAETLKSWWIKMSEGWHDLDQGIEMYEDFKVIGEDHGLTEDQRRHLHTDGGSGVFFVDKSDDEIVWHGCLDQHDDCGLTSILEQFSKHGELTIQIDGYFDYDDE